MTKVKGMECKACGSTDWRYGYNSDGDAEECFCNGCGTDLTQLNAITTTKKGE